MRTWFAKGCFLVYKGGLLFPLLLAAMVSPRVFDYAWKRYYVRDGLDKNLFNLCVQWLLYNGGRVGMTYTEINVVIFCLIWPTITLLSLTLNVVLLCMR